MPAVASGNATALTGGDAAKLRLWVEGARHCEYGSVVRFAYGLRKDLLAVSAAVESPWSTGQVEGQINRLKMIKRQMYGRAGFDLLRARVMPLLSLVVAQDVAHIAEGIALRPFNVLSAALYMAGFQVIMYGRFWVFTEGKRLKSRRPRQMPEKLMPKQLLRRSRLQRLSGN